MSSLRSRRTLPSERRPETTSYQRRRQRRMADAATTPNDKLAKIAVGIVFVLICSGLGYREYKRVGNTWQHNVNSVISAEEDAALAADPFHVIFSTDCSSYQHWQSYLVYYSAYKVRQPGHVTRIASGCNEEETAAIQEWFEKHVQPMSTRFHLTLTPKFSSVKNQTTGEEVGDYKFFNKPLGLKYWLENSAYFHLTSQQDDIVILIDPDMVLMRPITSDFGNEQETVISKKRKENILATRVQHGIPFAQAYGLGVQWESFDLDKIAGPDSPAKLVTKEDGRLYYPVGPPYIATARDIYAIAQKWTEFVPHVHAQYPHLLAEMYAYCIAAAHLGLRHQIIDSLMVSDTGVQEGEGWALVDSIPAGKTCDFAAHPQHDIYPVPSVVHMCHRYCVGEDWFFGKHRVPHDVYDCEKPLFVEPPSNVATMYDFRKPPNQKERQELSKKVIAREAFVVCFLTSLLNEAAAFYKKGACPAGTANLEKTLKMTDLFSAKERQ